MASQGPQRIVCLTEETTELFYLLGEAERIVGISAYTVRPPQAQKNHPVVSAFIGGSIPKIVALKPDLVIGFSDVQASLASDLIKANLNVLILNQRTLDEILEAMQMLGQIIHARDKTQELVESWKRTIDAARAKRRDTRPKVYFEEWDEPMISGIEWVRELIETAGGECLFGGEAAGRKADQRVVTPEQVVAAAPDVIIASWCGKKFDREALVSRPGFHTIPAVQNGRIHEMDSSIILQPGPACLTEGLAQLEALIHPSE